MSASILERLRADLAGLRAAGLYKTERVLGGPQGGVIRTGERDVINLCANNYLGLADHPALDSKGYGMASVRFICGTQGVHRQLEERISRFLGTDDAILYSSCFDANGGLFATILGEAEPRI